MENGAEKIFTELKDAISVYAGLKVRLLKVTAIERAARFLAALSHSLILMLLAFFTILFLFIALGFFFFFLFDSVALGFLIVGGIYFLGSWCFFIARNGIRVRLTNVFIRTIQTDDDDDSKENQSTIASGAVNSGKEGSSESVSGVRNEN